MNENALGALYDQYGKSAYSLAFRMLGGVHAAEDAVQEAFINIWRRAGSFSAARGTARTWIVAVVHHRTIDICRKRRGITARELPWSWSGCRRIPPGTSGGCAWATNQRPAPPNTSTPKTTKWKPTGRRWWTSTKRVKRLRDNSGKPAPKAAQIPNYPATTR